MSIEVLQQCNPPDRLFSLLEGRIFDSVAQHGTCQKRDAMRWRQRVAFKAWDDISPDNAGKSEKIELCAARLFGARGPGGRDSTEVNLEYEQLGQQ
jgi:hypothetical protein